MGAKRPKKPSRLAWFALDVDAFLDDPRAQMLTTREKSFWLSMLVRSFRNKGMMVADPAVVADQTGATVKEVEALLSKLFSSGLMKHAPAGERVFDAVSNRMAREHENAMKAYGRFSNMGQSSAEKNGTGNLKLVK